MSLRRSLRLQKYKRRQSDLEVLQDESAYKNEKIAQKENKAVKTTGSSSRLKLQACSKLKSRLLLPLAANSASSSYYKQVPLSENLAVKPQPAASGVLKKKSTLPPAPCTKSIDRVKQYYNGRVKSITLITDDFQLPKEKNAAEQRKDISKSNDLLEKRNESLTLQDVTPSGLNNTFNYRSHKPSTSKDRMPAEEKFTLHHGEAQLSSDILDLIFNSFVSKLTLDELLFLYWVNGTDNFDDFELGLF